MQFRYDIGEKIDLSNFKKQAEYYIRKISDNLFEFYMHDFLIEVRTFKYDIPSINSKGFFYSPGRRVTVRLFDLKRSDSCIIDKKAIYVKTDKRFKLFPEIQAMFYKDSDAESIVSMEDISKIADSVCILCTAVYKLGKLKAFL